ncbi:sulfatase [Achromobacter sp. NPDC058515]|uniref:sulfatase n=1 Tax=Achromobacter sp. NPDC058515 TaxID=3346533 RepID=UPI003650CF64
MKTAPDTPRWTFVKEAKTISKPGAVIQVRELTLTDHGLRAITSGSTGITQGVAEDFGPPSPAKRKLLPA